MVIRVNVHRGAWGTGLGQGRLSNRWGWFFKPTSLRDHVRRAVWIVLAIAMLVPLALLIILAGMAAAVIFLTLTLVVRIVAAILPGQVSKPTRHQGHDDGRWNVTVIEPGPRVNRE